MAPLREYKGAIHIHTSFSDGSGKVEDIIKAAQDAGLDYLIISDHDKLLPEQLEFQGRHGNLLVIYGVELRACVFGRRHFLALGVKSHLPYMKEPFPQRLEHIQRDGGISIIAHPAGPFRPWRGQTHFAWKTFPDAFFHGLEIWTYMHDWMGNLALTRLREKVARSDYNLSGPDVALLRRWDELNMRRRVSGIASQDNHARWIPFLRLRVFSYEYLFRRLLTHVITGEMTGDAQKDIPDLLDAIGRGNAYMANNGIAQAGSFRFTAETRNGAHGMGEWLEEPAKVLRVSSPQKAQMTLVRNGEVVAAQTTDRFELPDPPPGAYRVELRIDGIPWLFSNHINVGMPLEGPDKTPR
jgi:hypothetical protein